MESKNKARHKYNFSFKLKVIKFAEEKGKHEAAKFFNVDRKRVREWCQNKKAIETETKNTSRLPGAGRPVVTKK
jgi:transposase-like protein